MMSCAMEALERRAAARAFLGRAPEAGETRVKLCGMSREEDVDAVASARPDFVGFIVGFPKSRRSVAPERLGELVSRLAASEAGEGVWRVGVFVDELPEEVARIVEERGLDLVQLHGHEDAAYLEELRRALPGLGIVQAFRVRTEADVERACGSGADMVLLDNGQGTGERFDWSLASLATRPFMLAGGLSPDNVADAVEQVRPWGVDMSSGVETDGRKDPEKIKAAVAAVRGVTK